MVVLTRLVLLTSFLFVYSLNFSAPAFAAAIPVVLSSGEYFQTSDSTGSYHCGKIDGKWHAGKLLSSSKMTFRAYRSQVRALRLKLQTAPTASVPKLKTQIRNLNTLAKNGDQACTTAAGSKPSPTPKPTGTGTKSPTPTSTPITTGNFDSSGNVTSAGKSAFGIPSNLSANITTGKNFSLNNGCTGCHTEKTNRSFSVLKATTSAAPMFFSFSDPDLANLTAYLNRFRS